MNRHIWLLTIALLCLMIIPPANCKVYLVRSKNATKSCKVFRRPALHDLMDRVCLMCHEMFSHERPNLRSECRANCFKTLHFKQCLKVFMATSGQSSQSMGKLLNSDDAEE